MCCCLEEASTDRRSCTTCRIHDVVERKPVGSQLDRVDFNLSLPHLPAQDLRLGHAGDSQQLRLYRPLREVPQLERRQPFARKAEMDEVLHGGAQRRQQRRSDSIGQQTARLGQAFRHHLALAIRIPPSGKFNQDSRESLARSGADGLHVLGAGQQAFERPGHQRLDLSRIEAGCFGLDQHTRRREVRKHIEAHGGQCRGAEDRDEAGQCGDDARIGQRRANDGGQHLSVLDSHAESVSFEPASRERRDQ